MRNICRQPLIGHFTLCGANHFNHCIARQLSTNVHTCISTNCLVRMISSHLFSTDQMLLAVIFANSIHSLRELSHAAFNGNGFLFGWRWSHQTRRGLQWARDTTLPFQAWKNAWAEKTFRKARVLASTFQSHSERLTQLLCNVARATQA